MSVIDAPRRTILLLSGPNLAQLGLRDPETYGTDLLDDHVERAVGVARSHGMSVEHIQSNSEGVLVDAIVERRTSHLAVIINAGALTHYSWAIHDALAMFPGPVVELHISNPMSRESWRHTSVITPVATGLVAGFGGVGYGLAVEAVAGLLEE